jgi:high-affinity Fe2+/Pb2+ permease
LAYLILAYLVFVLLIKHKGQFEFVVLSIFLHFLSAILVPLAMMARAGAPPERND